MVFNRLIVNRLPPLLSASFIKRMNHRRNLKVMALLLYLSNPDVIENQIPDVFGNPQVKRP